ncbi:hypothetical protein JW766_00485 [Candidatus Dojkabacteria bacterium]|nr:hypothetical protein [Candidatus Dojkabacteria bacterium]
MEKKEIWNQLLEGKKPDTLVQKVISSKMLLSEVMEGVTFNKARVKFGCAKILRIISDKNPKLLYPHWNFFVDLLDSENKILKWNAIYIIANLSSVDNDNRFEKIFKKYSNFMQDKTMITTANTIGGLEKIVQAKPELTDKITKLLLETENGKWETSECKNIILGDAIIAFDGFFEQISESNKKKVLNFVKKRIKNRRNSTKTKAQKFLMKYTK